MEQNSVHAEIQSGRIGAPSGLFNLASVEISNMRISAPSPPPPINDNTVPLCTFFQFQPYNPTLEMLCSERFEFVTMDGMKTMPRPGSGYVGNKIGPG